MPVASKYTYDILIYPLGLCLFMWLIFWFEIKFELNFNEYGVYPRTIEGLRGVVLSPFIHSSLKHLFNNTVPLLLLSAATLYFYRKIGLKVIILGLIASGLLTWLIGRPSYHIGASGLVYVLATFLFFKGIFSKYYRLVAVSLGVVFLYGSFIWGLFPIKEQMSWEGHLSGFIVGFIAALVYKTDELYKTKYNWEQEEYEEEQDEFMQQFDDNGNFNPVEPEDSLEEVKRDTTPKIIIKYEVKSKKSPD
jgi:membrane associated rhomboid family serine protease